MRPLEYMCHAIIKKKTSTENDYKAPSEGSTNGTDKTPINDKSTLQAAEAGFCTSSTDSVYPN